MPNFGDSLDATLPSELPKSKPIEAASCLRRSTRLRHSNVNWLIRKSAHDLNTPSFDDDDDGDDNLDGAGGISSFPSNRPIEILSDSDRDGGSGADDVSWSQGTCSDGSSPSPAATRRRRTRSTSRRVAVAVPTPTRPRDDCGRLSISSSSSSSSDSLEELLSLEVFGRKGHSHSVLSTAVTVTDDSIEDITPSADNVIAESEEIMKIAATTSAITTTDVNGTSDVNGNDGRGSNGKVYGDEVLILAEQAITDENEANDPEDSQPPLIISTLETSTLTLVATCNGNSNGKREQADISLNVTDNAGVDEAFSESADSSSNVSSVIGNSTETNDLAPSTVISPLETTPNTAANSNSSSNNTSLKHTDIVQNESRNWVNVGHPPMNVVAPSETMQTMAMIERNSNKFYHNIGNGHHVLPASEQTKNLMDQACNKEKNGAFPAIAVSPLENITTSMDVSDDSLVRSTAVWSLTGTKPTAVASASSGSSKCRNQRCDSSPLVLEQIRIVGNEIKHAEDSASSQKTASLSLENNQLEDNSLYACVNVDPETFASSTVSPSSSDSSISNSSSSNNNNNIHNINDVPISLEQNRNGARIQAGDDASSYTALSPSENPHCSVVPSPAGERHNMETEYLAPLNSHLLERIRTALLESGLHIRDIRKDEVIIRTSEMNLIIQHPLMRCGLMWEVVLGSPHVDDDGYTHFESFEWSEILAMDARPQRNLVPVILKHGIAKFMGIFELYFFLPVPPK